MNPKQKQKENTKIFMENGPGLRYDYNTWIVAKDSAHNKVLIGGLGGMGCGQMWAETEQRHKDNLEYAVAPEESCCGFGIIKCKFNCKGCGALR